MTPKTKEEPEAIPTGDLTDAELNAIDAAVGARVRYRRILLGMSQQTVSARLGLTFQQLQKYEHGTNRISASRLVQLGMILRVPVSFFFETVPYSTMHVGDEAAADGPPADFMANREATKLIAGFYAIGHKRAREVIIKVIQSMNGK